MIQKQELLDTRLVRITRTLRSGTPIWAGAMFLALVLSGLPGCIVGATVATISLVTEATTHTATVQLNASPDEVYGAMMRIIAGDPSIEVKKNEPANRLISAAKGKNKVTAQARALDGRRTELIIKADADEQDTEDAELALRVEKRICNELGIDTRVSRQRG